MNLKPFNLVKALQGEPVVTRNGWVVIIAGATVHKPFICVPLVKEDEQLLGWVEHKELDGQWVIKSWTLDGKHFAHREGIDRFDLFML